jgi:8-oxo-dGTP pyrophosphatase MutT (NUDIX family)
MQTNQKIRVKALGLILERDRVFVSSFYEPVKEKTFYRALGGSVEFGETSLTTLQREFREEIQAELTNIRYLGCLENLFTYLGEPCHELIQLYQADFVDPAFYQLTQLPFVDGEFSAVAEWVPRDRFLSGELWLVPEACLNYL